MKYISDLLRILVRGLLIWPIVLILVIFNMSFLCVVWHMAVSYTHLTLPTKRIV